MPNLVFFSFPDPTISPLHQPSKLVISELLFKHQNTSSLIRVWWNKDLTKCTSQDYVNREGESRGIWRIKWWRLWMSQSYFSLRFLSQNSLSGSSLHFVGIRVFYSSVCEKCEKSVLIQIGHSGDLALWLEWFVSLSCELTTWLDCIFLSNSAPAVVTLQFPACFTRVPLWRLASREI